MNKDEKSLEMLREFIRKIVKECLDEIQNEGIADMMMPVHIDKWVDNKQEN